jgi:hypothetical protein
MELAQELLFFRASALQKPESRVQTGRLELH